MNRNPKTAPRKRGKKLVRRLIWCLILLLILGGTGLYLYDSLSQVAVTTYTGYTATIGSISNSLSFSGSLQLVNDQTCAAGAATSVRAIYVQEGQQVKKGDKLIRLANGENFTADFDGTVNQVYVEVDDDVAPAAQLVQIADFTHMKVSVRVDEYDITKVAVGQACTVTCTSTEKVYNSSIASINYISASSGNVAYYTTTAYMDVDEGVYPGMQVTVTVPQDEANDVVVLKVDAISFDPENHAFVLTKNEKGEYTPVSIEVGVSNGNYCEIKSGVKSGDVVYNTAKSSGKNGSVFSSMFTTTQVNPPSNRNGNGWNGGNGSGGWNNGTRNGGSGSGGGSR